MVEILFALALASTPPTLPHDPVVAPPVAPATPVVAEVHRDEPKKEEAKTEEPEKVDAPIPPPLTRKALCGEVTRTGKELAAARKRLDDDRKALDGERASLEKLKADITQARAGLRAETERLELMLAKRGDAADPAEAGRAAPRPRAPTPRPQELDGLARTMKSMKPEAAAALLQRAEPSLAAALLKRMKPADAGAVMDRLKPDLAADLMTLMSTLPSSTSKPGARL